MMRRNQTPRRVDAALAASTLVAVVAGCTTGDQPPAPEPSQPATYQQPPEDLCEQARFDEVLQQWDLSKPPSYETPPPAYNTAPAWWSARCWFAGMAEDGRFTTEFGKFQPTGGVDVRVFHEAEGAVREYDRQYRNHFERPEGGESAEVTGWWDTGVSVTFAEELDPEDFTDLDDSEITDLDTGLMVRHENLVVNMSLNARSPTGEADEAAALLQEVLAAVLDETAEHLPRDTG